MKNVLLIAISLYLSASSIVSADIHDCLSPVSGMNEFNTVLSDGFSQARDKIKYFLSNFYFRENRAVSLLKLPPFYLSLFVIGYSVNEFRNNPEMKKLYPEIEKIILKQYSSLDEPLKLALFLANKIRKFPDGSELANIALKIEENLLYLGKNTRVSENYKAALLIANAISEFPADSDFFKIYKMIENSICETDKSRFLIVSENLRFALMLADAIKPFTSDSLLYNACKNSEQFMFKLYNNSLFKVSSDCNDTLALCSFIKRYDSDSILYPFVSVAKDFTLNPFRLNQPLSAIPANNIFLVFLASEIEDLRKNFKYTPRVKENQKSV